MDTVLILTRNIGVGFTRLSLLLAMYTSKEWTKYGIWGCMCIVLEATYDHLSFVFLLLLASNH